MTPQSQSQYQLRVPSNQIESLSERFYGSISEPYNRSESDDFYLKPHEVPPKPDAESLGYLAVSRSVEQNTPEYTQV